MTGLLLVVALAGSLAQAVEAEPDRPGLRLSWAHALLEAGDAGGAEREARRVLREWPTSFRPHMVLAGVAFARGRYALARSELSKVAAAAPPPIALAARRALVRLAQHPGSGWTVRGVMGGAYDTRAEPPELASDDAQGTPAFRVNLGAGAQWRRVAGRWRYRVGGGVDRTGHVGEAGARDRLLARGAVRATGTVGGGLLGLRLEGRGALAGRVGTPHHVGGGLGAWYGAAAGPLSPWLEGRGLVYRFADGPDAGVLDVGLGLTTHARRWRGTARLGALRVARTDGYLALGGDVGVDLLLGPVVLGVQAGAAVRDDDAGLRPRAKVVTRWRLGERWSVLGDLRWRSAEAWTQTVAGLSVEVVR
jgi:hypothetical protein